MCLHSQTHTHATHRHTTHTFMHTLTTHRHTFTTHRHTHTHHTYIHMHTNTHFLPLGEGRLSNICLCIGLPSLIWSWISKPFTARVLWTHLSTAHSQAAWGWKAPVEPPPPIGNDFLGNLLTFWKLGLISYDLNSLDMPHPGRRHHRVSQPTSYL